MKRKEFGKLVANLRRQMTTFATGQYWSQAILAEETKLPKGMIIKLEQGLKQIIDAEILLRLADAFQLTTLERQEFFSLAVEISRSQTVRNDQDPQLLLHEVLEQLETTHLPAILYDPFYNIVAVNQLALTLHDISPVQLQETQQLGERINLLSCAFAADPSVRRLFGRMWPIFAHLNIHQFRAMTLRYRHYAYFKELFAKLSESNEFKAIWLSTQAREQDFYTELKHYCYHHPIHGSLHYQITMTPIITTWGKLYFSTLTPLNRSTFEVFSTLVKTVRVGILRLTPWPLSALHPIEIVSS